MEDNIFKTNITSLDKNCFDPNQSSHIEIYANYRQWSSTSDDVYRPSFLEITF